MRWSIVLLAIIGLVATSPIDTKNIEESLSNIQARNSLIEGQLVGLLEDLRHTMLTGSDDVPVLDPFVLDFLAVDDNVVPVPGLKVEIGEATVSKLSSFVVEELTVQRTTLVPLRYQLTFDAQVPVIEIDARHYDLYAPVEGVVVFGNGDAKINLIEPRLTGQVVARPTYGFLSMFIRLEEVQLRLSLKGFDSQINGLLGGDPGVGAFINTFLSYFVPDLVQLYEDDISELLSSTVLEVGNDILSDFNLIGIIGSG